MNETTRANLHELFISARTAIAEGVRDTVGRDVPDIDLIADAVLSIVHGIALTQRLTRDPSQIERQFDHLKRIFALAVFQSAIAPGGKP